MSEALPSYIDERQKGFMRGRLGIDHVLELELLGFVLASLGAPWLALVFLDMEAAFPSLSHKYLLRVVERFAGAHFVARLVADM